jgi:Straboviridae tail completion protein Gp15
MFNQNQTPPIEAIKTIVRVFGNLFPDISISVPQGSAPSKLVKVPLEWGPKTKWYVADSADPNKGITSSTNAANNQNPFERLFPRMVYNLESMHYNSAAKLSSTLQNVSLNGGSATDNLVQYVPVPWTFGFSLTIGTKNLSDTWQIIEQILPYFQPHLSVTINYFANQPAPTMTQKYTSQVLLKSGPTFDIDWKGAVGDDMRKVETTMEFDFNGYLFLPYQTGNLITSVTLKYDPFETEVITATTDTLTSQ